MSFVVDLLLTVTRLECVTTPYFTFPLPIVQITFLFLFCLYFPIGILVRIYENLDFPFPDPVLSIRKRLSILCVPLKFHNLPSRGNIIAVRGVSDVG